MGYPQKITHGRNYIPLRLWETRGKSVNVEFINKYNAHWIERNGRRKLVKYSSNRMA